MTVSRHGRVVAIPMPANSRRTAASLPLFLALTVFCALSGIHAASAFADERPGTKARVAQSATPQTGEPLRQSAELARQRDAAEHGDARAQFTVGWTYATGDGVPKDYAQAVRWSAEFLAPLG